MTYNKKVVLAVFEQAGISWTILEHKFHPERKWRFDFAWCANANDTRYWVALEVEGGLWIGGGHSRGSGRVKDIEKYSEAAAMGWRILYCQPKDLCTTATVNLIKRALSI